jgi:hypothetical protein
MTNKMSNGDFKNNVINIIKMNHIKSTKECMDIECDLMI